MPARIKVGIATYNDRGFLEILLESINWYTFMDEPVDVVVCDDGSAPDFKRATRELCERFGAIYIEHEQNQGIPATWNHLALSLDNAAEIVVLLNNDLMMPPNWLRTAVHFLDANKDCPHVGSVFWNPVNQVPMEAMRAWLPNLNHTEYVTRDTLTGKERDFTQTSPMGSRTGAGQGLGRVMCPCGCCFAFRRDVFMEVGAFREELVSFHEESWWGTQCAAAGRASFGLAYPRPYHGVGQTFKDNPELESSKRMIDSRAMYRAAWGVPASVPDDAYFDFVNQRLMPSIPPVTLRYLQPDYDAEPVTLTRADGAQCVVPALVEVEGTF